MSNSNQTSSALDELARLSQEMGEMDLPGVEAYRKCINDQSAEIDRLRAALGSISRIEVSSADGVNRVVLVSAILLAKAVL